MVESRSAQPVPAASALAAAGTSEVCRQIGRNAVRSLYAELALYPKPGLVSLVDSGSHNDMDASTFVRSLFALRRYFIDIAQAGVRSAPFAVLRQLGIDAEIRMLGATHGINTHRGAIFSLGLLCAARGYCTDGEVTPEALRNALRPWRKALLQHQGGKESNGGAVSRNYAVSGAREEAIRGFPSVFEIALPRLRRTLAEGRGWRCARIDALFALMAQVSDTNVYHRGGVQGAALVRHAGNAFLAAGGTAASDWQAYALAYHREFVRRRLSPGGAADLLAATVFAHHATLDKESR